MNQIQVHLSNLEAEQAVLGSVIYRNDMLDQIKSIVTSKSFYAPAHQDIFAAMLALDDADLPIDEVALGDRLKAKGKLDSCGGYPYLAELVDCVPASGNAAHYAAIVARFEQLRKVKHVADWSRGEGFRKLATGELDIAGFYSRMQNDFSSLLVQRGATRSTLLKDLQGGMFTRLEKVSQDCTPLGLMSGFDDLDNIVLGFDEGKLYVIAARPGMGKTAFMGCLNLAFSCKAKKRKHGLVVILEMTKEEMGVRYHCQIGKIASDKFKKGNLEQDDWGRLAEAMDELACAPIHLVDDLYSIDQIRAEAWQLDHELKAQGEEGLAYVCVDYLQLASGTKPGQPREQEIAEISRGLKELAKELKIPVFALSQLNRSLEARKDKRPQLSDLRESGAIEQDADMVMFIYRDEVYNEDTPNPGIAEIIISKHRNGATGKVMLKYHGPTYRFRNLANHPQPQGA